ncbi:MAG: FG-GAP repeat protein [Saprospiraceae bacterium]
MTLTIFFLLPLTPSTSSAQNVGIGTAAPAAKLDVNAASTFISRFNSNTNQGFITVSENNIPRAYFGSYAGAAEDVDLGTTASNLPGKLHLTIQSNPKLTIDNSGNVGIGTMVPSERLEVSGNLKMNGEIKPQGISGTSGQVLTSNGNGTMQWATPAAVNSTSGGNGGWGDCSIQNIDSYQPVVNPGSANGDNFGNAVAISGNYAIVGSFFDMENGMANAGSASFYKYDELSNNWQHISKFLDATPGVSEHFGYSVSISDDYAVVGNAKDTEFGITRCGSATVFKRNNVSNNWESQGKLFNLNPAQDDNFGYSVSISGDYIIVGANYDDENAIVNTGSAVIFKRNTSTNIWENQGKIINPAAANSDFFGSSVSIFGDFAIVGAPNDNENGIYCGSATIFKWNNNNNTWESQGKIIGQTPTSNEQFGTSVFLNGKYLAIGTLYEYQNNLYNGSVTLYTKNQNTNTWEFSKIKNGPSSAAGDRFGGSISVSDNYLMVGADYRTENGNLNAGSVTIYKRYENNWIEHESFSCPVTEAQSRFGFSLSLDPNSRKFVVGAPGFDNYSGLVNFGQIK